MKTLQWAITSSLVVACFAATAMAQAPMPSPVQQPSSIQQMAFQSDDSTDYALVDAGPTSATVLPASPSNQLTALSMATADEKPAEEKPAAEAPAQACEAPADEGPYKLFHGPWLECEHLDIRGYFDVGFTNNPAYPLSGFNGPNGYNDFANQFDLNQFYMIAERVAKVDDDCGVDYGYRGDVMFGTDSYFVRTTKGTQWDSNWAGGSPYYGLAMPQLYGTLQYNKLTLQGGHFYAPCGYENPMPTENFFYSHTYGFLYGMPTTLTGGMATYKVQDKLLVNAGFDSGWNEFTALNGKINTMFGVNWTSCDDKVNVTSEWFIGNMSAPGIDGTRTACVTDINVKLGCKWHYILENTVAHDSSNVTTGGAASWTGLTNYLLYDINDCWGFGLRYEYFEDLDGAVVPPVGLPAGLVAPAPFVLGSKYNDVTVGLNWKPNKNVTMRSEVRWDWAANGAVVGHMPYGDGGSNSQFTWGNDVVVRF